jgi:hypothetical protein
MAVLNRKSIDSLLLGSALKLTGKSGAYALVNHYSNQETFKAKTLPEIRQRITVVLGR